MDIRVVPVSVRAAGQAMGEAAYDARRVTPYDDLSAVGAALPGSRAAATAEALAGRWRHAFDSWVRAAEVHGEALAVGAGDYVAVELAVVGLLDAQVPSHHPEHRQDTRTPGWAA